MSDLRPQSPDGQFAQWTLTTGQRLYRCHDTAYPPHEPFAGSTSLRFSPLVVDGTTIPVLYAGDTKTCALHETVFRDLLGGTAVHRNRLIGRALTVLTATRDLALADLRSNGARLVHAYDESAGGPVGVWGPRFYSRSQAWARAVHAAEREDGTAWEGIAWNSRQQPGRRAVMLFGDRLHPGDLEPGPTETISASHRVVRHVANELGVILPVTPPRH